ncbi:13695_t:CDS:2 [Dentiscutata erythropus]|uniref:13695_t:CDS:1 n=1 Tax=Dentiscutata erythropus TaxID=1348616 RepID=A0A9N9C136_9GLOM|nr:13695_t:CDS:2 [Dentiscutata erythropus]
MGVLKVHYHLWFNKLQGKEQQKQREKPKRIEDTWEPFGLKTEEM